MVKVPVTRYPEVGPPKVPKMVLEPKMVLWSLKIIPSGVGRGLARDVRQSIGATGPCLVGELPRVLSQGVMCVCFSVGGASVSPG